MKIENKSQVRSVAFCSDPHYLTILKRYKGKNYIKQFKLDYDTAEHIRLKTEIPHNPIAVARYPLTGDRSFAAVDEHGMLSVSLYLKFKTQQSMYTEKSVKVFDEPAQSLAFSPDKKYVAVASESGQLKICKFFYERQKVYLKDVCNLEYQESISGLSFGPDGKLALATKGIIGVYELDCSNKDIGLVTSKSSSVGADVSFSPDGRYLVNAELNGCLRIFEFGENRRFNKWLWRGQLPSTLNGVDFSPDNKHLAVACGNDVYVYELKNGKQ